MALMLPGGRLKPHKMTNKKYLISYISSKGQGQIEIRAENEQYARVKFMQLYPSFGIVGCREKTKRD